MEMTRAEHLAWAKQRALEYVDRREPVNAIASMLSDLNKHPELERHAGKMLFLVVKPDDGPGVRKWIEGFN
jgi:hypothetical protein